ncbi:MAG: helix-turn-helix domain-containing protein, partial [Candidatus Nitrosoglobus sp.]
MVCGVKIGGIIEGAASRYLQYPLATCHRPNRKSIEAMTNSDSIKIQRSYKFRCYPNSIQRQRLAVEFGHARWVWNKCLVWRNHAYEAYGETVTAID